MIFLYKDDNKVTAKIIVDYTKNKVTVKNYSDFPLELPFGINTNPTIKDFEDLLEERCFPRTKDKLKLHLEALGIDYYDPLTIVLKTKGRLEGDFYSLECIDKD